MIFTPKKISIIVLMASMPLWLNFAKAGTVYEYRTKEGQAFLTNIQQNTSGSNKFTQVGVTYYPDTKIHADGQIPATYNPSTASTPSRSANKNAFDHLIRAAALRHGVDPRWSRRSFIPNPPLILMHARQWEPWGLCSLCLAQLVTWAFTTHGILPKILKGGLSIWRGSNANLAI